MRLAAKAAIGLVVAIAVASALALWVEAGNPPRFVRAGYDGVARLVSGEDPMRRCYTTTREPGGTTRYDYVGARACYDFLPPRRFTGVYVDEFEGQMFIEGAREAARYTIPCRWVWFTVDEKSDVRAWKGFNPQDDLSSVWLLDFVGRETRPAAGGLMGYGHLGASDAEVIVDRIVSARLVGTYEGYSTTGGDALVTWKEGCPVR